MGTTKLFCLNIIIFTGHFNQSQNSTLYDPTWLNLTLANFGPWILSSFGEDKEKCPKNFAYINVRGYSNRFS
jgi:hypothetical protein